MMGFFLEFSNCFVQQEPICLVENIYTKEEYERYKNYLSRGLEDKRNISVVVSLGKDNPLRNEESSLKVAADRFCGGEIVSNLQVTLQWQFTALESITLNEHGFDVSNTNALEFVKPGNTNLTIEEGSEIELSAIVLPEDTTDATVKWSIDNSEVATIDNDGKVVALAEGTVVITAQTTNGLTDTIEIEIYHTSLIVNIIAAIVFLAIVGGLSAGPIFLIIWLRKKIKNRKN